MCLRKVSKPVRCEGRNTELKAVGKFGDTFKDGLHKPTFHDGGLHAPMEASGKAYESEFHYLRVCHDLSGKNAGGGCVGLLFRTPFGMELKGS